MNWPYKNLRPDILAKYNARITKFELEQTDLADPSANNIEGTAALELCVDLYTILKESEDPRIKEQLLVMGGGWDTEKPELTDIQKFINRVMTERLAEASEYMERATNRKVLIISEGVTQAKSISAKESADKGHAENNRIKAEAIDYYKNNQHKYTNKTQAAYDLEIKYPPLKFETYYKALKKV